MTSTGAVQDLLTGWYLTGTGRLVEAFVNTVGLVVGIEMGIRVLRMSGVGLTIGSDVAVAPHPLWMMLIIAALVAGSFCIVSGLRLSAIPAAAVLTCSTWAAFTAFNQADFDPVWAAGLAALVAGLASPLFGGLMRIPAANLASITVILMFPGLLIYRGLLSWSIDFASGFQLLLQALSTAMALAIGVMFGQYLTTELMEALARFRHLTSTFLPHFMRPFWGRGEHRISLNPLGATVAPGEAHAHRPPPSPEHRNREKS